MKIYVLDASALIVFLRDQPGAPRVGDLLREAMRGRARVLMSAVNYGEVYGLILCQNGQERAWAAIQAVSPLSIEVLEATPQRACQAADLKSKHKLYYADSFAAALAIEHRATLVTSDSDFRKLGHGFPVAWLKT
ncbi:MAG: type II toxin-antitoxin system VapC family toxin [Terriglobales bacterium]